MATSRKSRTRLLAAAALSAAALTLGSCATPTPYQPATAGTNRGGYWDEQIENNRFRVSFAGNSLTSRDTVERYLLYRAAELTVERGFDHFILVSRDTETRTTQRVEPRWSGSAAFGGGPWGYWRPYWRWYRPRYGWRSWDPFWGDPFYDRDFDVRTINRYEATAEIVTGRGPKPGDNVRSFNAREVLERLGPGIQVPQPR